MICPYCKKEFLSRHVVFCEKRDKSKSNEELRAFYLMENIPNLFEYEKLYEIYINKKWSLPKIREEFKIDYKNIQFMLTYFNIPIRNHSEGAMTSMEERVKTNIERYGAKNVLSKGTEKYHKKNKTVREKYGVDNVFQIPEIIEKIKSDEIYLERHNMTRKELISKNAKKYWNSLTKGERREILKNFFSKETFDKIKQTKIKTGSFLSDDKLTEFQKYRNSCRRLTKLGINNLMYSWDGFDFYDNEFILDNFNLKYTDPNYPTIDHKISIFDGFNKNIKPEVICDINNLCITKRSINSSKGVKSFYHPDIFIV